MLSKVLSFMNFDSVPEIEFKINLFQNVISKRPWPNPISLPASCKVKFTSFMLSGFTTEAIVNPLVQTLVDPTSLPAQGLPAQGQPAQVQAVQGQPAQARSPA